jgi:hypothetical protein
MKIGQWQKLKRKLTHESDLSKIWSFYMDRFADREEFTELGEPAQSDYLEAVIPKICQQMFGKAIAVTNFLSITIAEFSVSNICSMHHLEILDSESIPDLQYIPHSQLKFVLTILTLEIEQFWQDPIDRIFPQMNKTFT